MDFKSSLILIFVTFFGFSSSQIISCDYKLVDGVYKCDATINNANGDDALTAITGTHLNGMTNDDVLEFEFVDGTTPIVPRTICETFKNLQKLETYFYSPGIETLTETSFASCVQLISCEIAFNPVTNIHEDTFKFNVNLEILDLIGLEVTTIPEKTFSTLTKLTEISIAYSTKLTDLPANIFKNLNLLLRLMLYRNGLQIWRPEWTQSLTTIYLAAIDVNLIPSFPRNSLNSPILNYIFIQDNNYRELDYFMFNDIRELLQFTINNSPVEAIDFNLIDRATKLESFDATNCICINRNFMHFNENRTAFIAELEPCFAAFDQRILDFSTSGSSLTFNSIRKETIHLQVQATSDAIIKFSQNPDGTGFNFEIQLGVNGNMDSCIYENGVHGSCHPSPGILNPTEMKEFEILWSGGYVYVIYENPILYHYLIYPFQVRFIGVGTRGSPASWIIQQI